MAIYFVVGDSGPCSIALGMSSRVEIHFNLIGGHVRVVDVVSRRAERVAVWLSAHVTRRLSQAMGVSHNTEKKRKKMRVNVRAKNSIHKVLGFRSFVMIHVHTWQTVGHTKRSSSWRRIPARRD